MRIAIVNDSAMAVEVLRRVLSGAPQHEIAWVARNGSEAVDRCARDTPDLILMDLVMPVMDGVEATRKIMAQSACAILIVTATVEAHTAKVFDALGAGAVDAVKVPVLESASGDIGSAALLRKIRSVELLTGNARGLARRAPVPPEEEDAGECGRLVAIGASAGGPAALRAILGGLPRDFSAAVAVVQHVDVQFAPLMAAWLDDRSPLSVRTAREGDQPRAGQVLIAETNEHMVLVNRNTYGYTREPLDAIYRPSADVFFESVVRHWKGEVVGVLLTGMGNDGARGLYAIRQTGALTIAQDHATSVVYGMPKAARQIGAAAEILPLDSIARRLADVFATPSHCGK